MIKINSLTKTFANRKQEVVALNNVDISLEDKGLVFINGVSGSGKTTLMNIVTGLERQTSGSIQFEDFDASNISEGKWDAIRNTELGIIFQNFNLLEDITVYENIVLPLKIQNVSDDDYKRLCRDTLNYVGLKGYENRKINELSAGQKQRVAIARAIVKKPKVIVADEATGNLDGLNTAMVLNLLNDISKDCLVILISHDIYAARRYADRIITLDEGKIILDVDNKKMKELYNGDYQYHITNEKIDICDNLDCLDIMDVIEKEGEWNKDTLLNMKFNVAISLKEKGICSTEYDSKPNVLASTKSLAFKEIIANVFHHFNRKKTRKVFTTFLIAFISMLFLVINTLNANDFSTTLMNAITSSESSCFSVYEKGVDINEIPRNIYKGETYISKLIECIGEDRLLKIHLLEFENEEGYSDSMAVIDYSECNFFKELSVEGELPTNDNEVVLSYIYSDSYKIGDILNIGGTFAKVVGFANTKIGGADESCSIVSPNISNTWINNITKINLQGFNIKYAMDIDNIATAKTISSMNVLSCKENELVSGSFPENENEVLVSKTFADEIMTDNNDTLVENYLITDLHSDKFDTAFSDMLNLYDYVGRKLSIVGVYDEEKESTDIGNIVFVDSVYQNIINDYKEYFNYSSIYAYFDSNSRDDVKRLNDNGFVVEDENFQIIYTFMDITTNLKNVSSISNVVCCLMIIFLLVISFVANVKDNAKKIGIYRAIGINSRDISKIYLFEAGLICAAAMILAMIGEKLVINMINAQFSMSINESIIKMINIDLLSSVKLCVMILIISLIITAIPIIKMSKKKSIKLINAEN